MIAGCPKCSARYRVDLEQIGEDGAKLRCTKCSAVFLVRAPKKAPKPVAVDSPAQPAAAAAGSPTHEASTPEPELQPGAPELVLIADSDEDSGKQTATAVQSWGLSPIVVHDGVEAMLSIQRMLPKVVVLDAALPKMFGFQVCEVVKRNESLRATRVVLVGAVSQQDRYRRDPSELYGADVYLERPDLPDGLLPLLREAGLPLSSSDNSAPTPAPASAPTPSLEPPIELDNASDPFASQESGLAGSSEAEPELVFEEPIPTGPAPAVTEPAAPVAEPEPAAAPVEPVAVEDPEITAERERAERLARIAVSEMLLYQPEKFDQAIQDGNVEAVLDLEIQEARSLIQQRISEEVRGEKDFILAELERVAQERSGGT